MSTAKDAVAGYDYGSTDLAPSPVTMADLKALLITVGWTGDDAQALREAGGILKDQVRDLVLQWRAGIIASIPHLARHSRSPQNEPLPQYLERSNRRFELWVLDTCFRPYDQTWLDYQNEIALRHMSVRKNRTDGVQSTPYVPFHDALAFTAVMNDTIRPYLAKHGHAPAQVERMHAAWRKSLQLQMALWAHPYMDRGADRPASEW
jgi:hypothetical protein